MTVWFPRTAARACNRESCVVAGTGEQIARRIALQPKQAEQKVFGGNIFVLEIPGSLKREIKQLGCRVRKMRLGRRIRQLGKRVDGALHLRLQCGRLCACARQQWWHDTFAV